MRKLIILTLSLSLLSLMGLTACTKIVPYYKPDIQQGNVISQTQVNKLQRGMTQKQVIGVLGTPVIEQAFDTDQLVYVNTNMPGSGKITEKRLVLRFKHDRLVSTKGDFKVSF